MKVVKFRAYIPELDLMIADVDVYASGMIGIDTHDLNLPDNHYLDFDDSCIRKVNHDENGTDYHIMNFLQGEDYIWFEKGFELMQSTGLKDKYETDIYDCDVLKFIGGTCDILHNGLYNYQYYEKGAKLVVQCLLSGFTLRNPSHIGDGNLSNRVGNVGNYDFWNHSKSLIITGNIYENPELLNP